ncbi:putative antitoxin YezG [Sporomusa silvacetica DSM 10669]|uniref:Antitoxin YezG n=1 Tax=Sporomusa silvacetica DSM 10669 TaxID=1123289 RepID=A0ABZ3IPG4_9FIRM|nr:immunity protein YezG family protein [Sporomusa silvacetica]OZC15885.1 putative antitoxin YezG [Sporomusa silvacetica DSM 10669]
METKKMEEFYPRIAELLNQMIPEEWSEILLYSEVREGFSQVYFYYYPKADGKPIYSLDIVDIFDIDKRNYKSLKQALYDCFERLWEEFKIQGQEPWTNLTFLLDSEGKMKIDYNYDDISQISPVEKQDKWEAKYLGYKNCAI